MKRQIFFFSCSDQMLTLFDVALCGEPSLDRPGIFSAATHTKNSRKIIATARDTGVPLSDYDLISKRLKLYCPPSISSNKHELSGPRSRNKNTPRWKLQLCERPLDILYVCLSAAQLQKPGASLRGLTEWQREWWGGGWLPDTLETLSVTLGLPVTVIGEVERL